MNRKPVKLPAGYEVLIHGIGPRDIAIRSEAKVELMKASKQERAALWGTVVGYASGQTLPTRMWRLPDCWHPSERARRRVKLTVLTPIGLLAYGFECTVQGTTGFFITGIDLRDASAKGERDYTSAGEEALRLAKWVGEDGGSHVAATTSR